MVGMTLAVQYAIVAVFAFGWGGRLSDVEEGRCQQQQQQQLTRERQQAVERQSAVYANDGNNNNINNNSNNNNMSCWGLGRLKVLSFSILLGTCAILGHAVPSLYTQYYSSPHQLHQYQSMQQQQYQFQQQDQYHHYDQDQQQYQQHQSMQIVQFPHELAWQIGMRCLYALSLAIMAPCLDGLALAHLDCIENASQADFGKERMYGAAFWGMGSLCAGVGIDRYGFGFLYGMTVVAAVMSYMAIGVYWIGLRWDTTGAFGANDVVPVSSTLSSLQVAVGEEGWNGMNEDQRNRGTMSSRNTSLSNQTGDENNQTSAIQLFNLICQTGYGKALLFFVFSLALGISIVDNLAFIFFDTLGSSNTMNGLTVVFTVVSRD